MDMSTGWWIVAALMMVVMMGIAGVMCILMGLLAEIVTRTWHESQAKRIYLVKSTRNLPTADTAPPR